MRRSVALTLMGLAAASPLAAQFEGTVTMKMSAPGGQAGMTEIVAKTAMKGGKTASVISMPAGGGQMAGMEIRSIFDPATNTATVLMPMPPQMASMPQMQGAKGMKMVTDLSKVQTASSNEPAPELKKLGTTETILGMSCDDYEMTPANGTSMRMCVTAALGKFTYPGSTAIGGRRGGGGGASPSWTTVFGNKSMFPLKVWSTDGKVAMEVINVDKSPVPASMFEIPEGYMDMSSMMGGMRPPR